MPLIPVGLLLCLAVTPLPPDAHETFNRLKKSVVHLSFKGDDGLEIGSATGFFVDADGTVATNEHVVQGAVEAQVAVQAVLADGTTRPVLGVLARGDVLKRDLAIIRIAGSGYVPLKIGDSKTVEENDEVFVEGGPDGLSFTSTRGFVSALRPKGLVTPLTPDEYSGPLIQMAVPITHGSSGSPVVDTSGTVVGVAASVMEGGGEIGFAVPSNELSEMLRSIKPGQKPQSFVVSRLRNLYISLAGFAVLAGAYAFSQIRKRRRIRARYQAQHRYEA